MPDYQNYDDVLDQLRSYGLTVDSLDIDTTRPVRCRTTDSKEKRGWYWLSSLHVNTEDLIIGAYGIYQGADNGKQIVTLSRERKDRLTPEQIQAQKARHREAQKRAEAERQREADKAASRAKVVWSKSLAKGDSEYLQRKQIGAYGVRFTDKGAVIVPMMDDRDTIRGLQFILPRGHERAVKAGRDKEFWPKGLQMSGTYHLVGKPPRDILLIAEGYATAASIHEATNLPVAVVWSANNIMPACQALKKKYKRARQLICADDDWVQKCSSCGKYTDVLTETCKQCGEPHKKSNAGIVNAQAAATAVSGAWIIPVFSAPRPTDKKGPTDFNDLHALEGLSPVTEQIEAKIDQLRWCSPSPAGAINQGGGEKRGKLKSVLTVDEAVERFALVFGGKGTMFDFQEHILVPKNDVLDVLPEHGWRDMRAVKRVVRLDEVGFDPSGSDPKIICNLWGGWPTTAKQGGCACLLELLQYLCSNEEHSDDVYKWVLNWLAYPIQNPGAKMRTALIFHGPQGTGKNLFFESIMAIYGEYGRIVDQAAIEDKFNDWASKKLFLIADEVVARTELYHVKNKLKSFVTGEWIRINPKNVSAHDERNHVNLVFLSNEAQPLALENDDRRYTVVHTPEKLPQKFYEQIRDEIKAGGVAALHHYLLNIDLTGFDEHSKPPETAAKQNLIAVSLDSVNSFVKIWQAGDIQDVPFCPCLATQLYTTYRRYCEKACERTIKSYRNFIGTLKMLPGWQVAQPYNTFKTLKTTERISRKMIIPPDHILPEKHLRSKDQTQELWLTSCYFEFSNAGGFTEC